MGLSFFNSEQNARAKFEDLIERLGNRAFMALGKNIAEGTLNKETGKTGLVNHEGHFSFYTYDGIHLKESFKIISSLKQ